MSEYYWVGDSGEWTDYTNHWSDTSGGSPGVYINAPTVDDNVYFDANSFTGAGTVSILSEANARTFKADEVTNTPVFDGSANIVLGSLDPADFLLGTVSWNSTGAVVFNALYASIKTSGNTISEVRVGNDLTSTSGLSLLDNLNCNVVTFNGQNLDLNNKNVTAGTLTSSASNGTMNFGNGTATLVYLGLAAGTLEINLGTAIINVTGGSTNAFENNAGVNSTVNAGSSTINLTGTGGTFVGGGFSYNSVVFTDNYAIRGGNTFNNLELGAGKTYKFEVNKTQTINTVSFDGSGTSALTTIKSINDGTQHTFSKSSGTVSVQYVDLKDSNATGGAVFITQDSTDSGNNTGWFFGAWFRTLVESLGLSDTINYLVTSYRGITLGKKPHIDKIINLQPKVGRKYTYRTRS